MVDTNTPTIHTPVRRLEFIDLLRGWAVIVMIETHVFNATLATEITSGGLFQYIKFVNGLVAPSFLFAAGLAYAVTTRRKITEYLAFGPPLFKQFSRLLLVLFIGYMLHLPEFNFQKLLHETTQEEWNNFFQVDILQCIAVSLIFMQVLLLVLRSERRLYGVTGLVAVLIVLLSPLVWQVDFATILPMPMAAYFNGLHSSLFPLFPWSAFLFAGAITGYIYLRAKESADPDRMMRLMKLIVLMVPAIIVLAILLRPTTISLYPAHDYWRAGPNFFFLRLAIVLLLCAIMLFFEQKKGVSSRSVVTLIGRESLLVYVLHLLMIYGDFGTFNFQKTVDRSFVYAEACVVTAALWVFMYLLAWGWSRVKRNSPRWKMTVQVSIVVVLVLVFFFGPGS